MKKKTSARVRIGVTLPAKTMKQLEHLAAVTGYTKGTIGAVMLIESIDTVFKSQAETDSMESQLENRRLRKPSNKGIKQLVESAK